MRLRGHAGWLVLVWAVACSVYDESLLTIGGPVGTGGGGSAGDGNGGSSGSTGGGGTGTGGAGSSGGGAGGSAGTVTPPGGGGATDGGQGGQGPVPVYELIDDMEDGNSLVLASGGRNGRWVTDNDGSAGSKTTPAKTNFPGLVSALAVEDARDGSTRSVHLRAEGFTTGTNTWGAFVGVHFKMPDSTPYDAAAYCGIHFWAKRGADVDAFFDQLEIRIPDLYTIPTDGNCTDPAAPASGGAGPGLCYDHHAKIVYPTDEWQEFTIYFSEMQQGNWPGYEQSPLDGLDLTAITSIEFYLNRPAVYDFWVDDLSFINKPESGDCPVP